MLAATGIHKSYGDVVALRGADLTVSAGEVVSLLGRNGAGKSTLLSVIAGLLAPDSGSVVVGGRDMLTERQATAELVGIAPQETGIYRAVTVRENLGFFAELAGYRRKDRNRRVDEVAEMLGLGPLLDRKATQLSGGEARRLHTACALVHEPRLLLLDEPTVGADVATRNQLIEVVSSLAAEGAAVIYTTHYLPEVEALAADIVVIDDGRILARGTQHELLERYRTSGVEITLDRQVAELPEQLEARRIGPFRWACHGATSVADAVDRLGRIDVSVVAAEAIRLDLERAFLEITGRALDDEGAAESAHQVEDQGAER